VGEVFK